MNLVPSDTFSYAELAELFTRGYEGYFVPMHFDEPTLRYMVDTWDIDLARSRVAPDAGLCNLAIRGDRGWIGGIAVVPEERRNGVGRALMEAVLELAPPTRAARGDRGERAGDSSVRVARLRAHARRSRCGASRRRALRPNRRPSLLGQTGLPWQREDASLPPDYERVEVDGGAMLFRGGDGVPARGARRGRGRRAPLARDDAQLRERP